LFEALKSKISSLSKIKEVLTEGEISLDDSSLRDTLWEFQIELMECDVALPVAERISEVLRERLIGKKRKIGTSVEEIVREAFREIVDEIFIHSLDFDEFIEKTEKPILLVFIGVNGTGKTTTIAKIAKRLLDNDYTPILASGDTFRAGAEEQLREHAERLGIRVIAHRYGADPAAVIYDAVAHARARKADVVLADTSGRMHTNVNLMDQLRKICRVNTPDLVIFVDEAIAGNDAVERAMRFEREVGIDAHILTKVDADAKGGTALSVVYETKKPIAFFGTGQRYEDLKKFSKDWFLKQFLGE
jgi:fused signal recognition particle receptor